MRENTLKQQLYAGKAAFGVMCTFPSPPVVEMLGYLGFDWILLDNEHGSITVDTAEGCIAVAELTGMAPMPHRPSLTFRHDSSAVRPRQVISPTPVITTESPLALGSIMLIVARAFRGHPGPRTRRDGSSSTGQGTA